MMVSMASGTSWPAKPGPRMVPIEALSVDEPPSVIW